MKISKKSQYGLRAMAELASYYEEGPLSAKSISKNQAIPLQYLEQIFSRLKRKMLVKTARGPRGGYVLSREPSKIKVADIIRALEDKYFLTDCLTEKSKTLCSRTDICVTKKFWEKLNRNIKAVLNSTTLKDLCPGKSDESKDARIGHNYLFQI